MRWLLAAAALLLLAGVATATQAPPPFPQAYGEQDGVSYFFASGGFDTGSLSSGPAYDGHGLVEFHGCALVQLRPAFHHGRMAVSAVVDNGIPLAFFVDDLEGKEPGMDGGLTTNQTLDGSLGHGAPLHPPVFADAAAWGIATGTTLGLAPDLQGRLRLDPNAPFHDPVSGDLNMSAQFLVTRQGFRDDATHGIPTVDGGWFDPDAPKAAKLHQGDEIHLHIQSVPGARPTPAVVNLASTGVLPDGTLAPSSNHTAVFLLPNTRWGGTARVHMSAQAVAAAGQNEIAFNWYSPKGDLMGSKTLAPALAQDAAADLEFPLDHLGDYVLRVTGKVSLAKYQATVVLQPAKSFGLDLWWDGVTFGAPATGAYAKCQVQLDQSLGSVEPTIVHRAPPPPFPVAMVVVAVVGTLSILAVITKLTHDTLAGLALKKNYRK